MTRPLTALLATALCAMLACSAAAQSVQRAMEISNAWARATPGRETTAYLTITNTGDSDRIVGITSAMADKVTLHRTSWVGLNQSTPEVDSIAIPGGGRLTMRPGGYHLRLAGLTQSLRQGQTVPLTLRFERAGRVETTLQVSNRMLGGN